MLNEWKILEMFMPRVVFVLISFIVANFANAAENFTTSEFNKLGSINVVLNDNASDACWTNLTESREYAEEKVLMACRYAVCEVSTFTEKCGRPSA